MTTWHKGPPPSIGWWPASHSQIPFTLRWWDGNAWSIPCWDYLTKEEAAEHAANKSFWQDIKWADRPASWPERSRT